MTELERMYMGKVADLEQLKKEYKENKKRLKELERMTRNTYKRIAEDEEELKFLEEYNTLYEAANQSIEDLNNILLKKIEDYRKDDGFGWSVFLDENETLLRTVDSDRTIDETF